MRRFVILCVFLAGSACSQTGEGFADTLINRQAFGYMGLSAWNSMYYDFSQKISQANQSVSLLTHIIPKYSGQRFFTAIHLNKSSRSVGLGRLFLGDTDVLGKPPINLPTGIFYENSPLLQLFGFGFFHFPHWYKPAPNYTFNWGLPFCITPFSWLRTHYDSGQDSFGVYLYPFIAVERSRIAFGLWSSLFLMVSYQDGSTHAGATPGIQISWRFFEN